MDKKIKQKWIDALVSEEYKQGIEQLRKEDGEVYYFCCLGVLCDIYAKEKGLAFPQHLSLFETLPEIVSDWAGLGDDEDPIITINVENVDLKTTCTAANDGFRLSFKELAKAIENSL